MFNDNCDGAGPHTTTGEVRSLPYAGGNLILCAMCLEREIAYRRQENLNLSDAAKYDLPSWLDLKVYGSN